MDEGRNGQKISPNIHHTIIILQISGGMMRQNERKEKR
jgi:hypothetical protein